MSGLVLTVVVSILEAARSPKLADAQSDNVTGADRNKL
jgi:hypothetical protein